MQKTVFLVPAAAGQEAGPTLAAMLRGQLEISWIKAQQLCERGKVSVNGDIVLDPARRPRAGATVEVDERRPAPKPLTVPILFEDPHVVVIDKPSGMSSVPYEKREAGTAMDAVRDAWRVEGRRATEQPLFVVHRIDKDTSGLIAFAKTKEAEKAIQGLFRTHDVERTYICVVHGRVGDRRIESRLVEDRGDGLRGSTRAPKGGKRAVTHVRVLEAMPDTTLLEVRLETGKTHQIRIHLSELGHPLVGERVYVRDYLRRVGDPIECPRLLLHAATLGFAHPITKQKVSLSAAPPPAFERQVKLMRKRPVPAPLPVKSPAPRAPTSPRPRSPAQIAAAPRAPSTRSPAGRPPPKGQAARAAPSGPRTPARRAGGPKRSKR